MEGFKNKITKTAFLDWYFSESDDIYTFGNRCIDMLRDDGIKAYTVEMLFNECGYIPEYICVDNENDSGVEYHPSEVEFINE